MQKFTYADLVDRYGEPEASFFLAEIEKAAGIKPQLANVDSEARLAYAFGLQDASTLYQIAA